MTSSPTSSAQRSAMSNADNEPRPADWCRRLRWKSYSVDKEDAGRLALALGNGGAPFSCLATALAVGPDDNLAAPDRCDRRRICYEEHPLQIRRRQRQTRANEEGDGNV